MRMEQRMIRFVILALLLSGCIQPISTPQGQVTAGSGSPTLDAGQGYPQPELGPTSDPYQPPANVPGAGNPYPAVSDGSEVPWEQAVYLMTSGQVEKVLQTHDGQVWLTLKDGLRVHTLQPEMDAVIRVIEACGAPCEGLRIATE